MTPRSEHQHVDELITDYVLDLLPRLDHEAVSRHIKICGNCRQAVMLERQIGLAVKQTLNRVGHVEGRSRAHMIPGRSRNDSFWRVIHQGQRQILIACCLLFLGLASVGIQMMDQHSGWPATAPAIVSTSLMNTETPTSTLLPTSEGSKLTGIISPTPVSKKMIPLPEAALAPPAKYWHN